MSRVAALAWGAALATVLSDELTVPRLEAVERWAMDAGVASQEAEAFEAVARRHPLPRDALVEFCHGQRGDLAGDWPITEADVNRYCYRVAGTTGIGATPFDCTRARKGAPMETKDIAAAALTGIGGVNWGLVAFAEFDLVAKLTGNRFGSTNAASRLVYGLVGAAAVYQLARVAQAAK